MTDATRPKPRPARLATGCAAALLSLASLAPTSAPPVATADRLRRDVAWLADDAREGRGVGSAGLEASADYLQRRFAEVGLQTLPALDGYAQRFDCEIGTDAGPGTRLALAGDAAKVGADAVPLAFGAAGAFEAPVAFAGYGVADAKRGYDDYAGLDVRGKAVLVLRYEPHAADGSSRLAGRRSRYSPNAALARKARVAAERGAAAVVVVNPPAFHGDAEPLARGGGGTLGGGPGAWGDAAPIPVLHVTPAVADRLLEKAGSLDLASLQRRIDETGRPASFELGRGVRASGAVEPVPRTVAVRNVVGVIRGAGPTAGEVVVIGAHYDAVGRGEVGGVPQNRGKIHNGADDNASGVAAVLAVAERLASGPPPARTVVVALFTAEERGLVGSRHFVDHPPVPLDRVVAMVNLDMVGRAVSTPDDAPGEATLYVGGAGTSDALDPILAAADAASAPLAVRDHGVPYIGRSGDGPSDHAAFAAAGVPSLFLYTGPHADYHRPSDDADRIDYARLAAVADLAGDVVERLTVADRPRFADVAANPATRPAR